MPAEKTLKYPQTYILGQSNGVAASVPLDPEYFLTPELMEEFFLGTSRNVSAGRTWRNMYAMKGTVESGGI